MNFIPRYLDVFYFPPLKKQQKRKKKKMNDWGKCLGLAYTGYGPGRYLSLALSICKKPVKKFSERETIRSFLLFTVITGKSLYISFSVNGHPILLNQIRSRSCLN